MKLMEIEKDTAQIVYLDLDTESISGQALRIRDTNTNIVTQCIGNKHLRFSGRTEQIGMNRLLDHEELTDLLKHFKMAICKIRSQISANGEWNAFHQVCRIVKNKALVKSTRGKLTEQVGANVCGDCSVAKDIFGVR